MWRVLKSLSSSGEFSCVFGCGGDQAIELQHVRESAGASGFSGIFHFAFAAETEAVQHP